MRQVAGELADEAQFPQYGLADHMLHVDQDDRGEQEAHRDELGVAVHVRSGAPEALAVHQQ
eukprot:8521761-Pyramimonas_sp.AAC.1